MSRKEIEKRNIGLYNLQVVKECIRKGISFEIIMPNISYNTLIDGRAVK